MAKKKTTTKKAAKNNPSKKVESDVFSYNILQGGFSAGLRESMAMDASLAKRDLGITSFGESNLARKYMMGLEALPLQKVINAYGFRNCSIVDVVGEEGIGKTTLVMNIAGQIARVNNSPTIYLETEGKPLGEDRMLQALSQDPREARLLRDNAVAIYQGVDSFQKVYNTMLAALWNARYPSSKDVKGLPMEIPILVVLDTFSKLQGKIEAEAHAIVETKTKGKTIGSIEDVLKAGDFSHAKFAHRFSRMLPALMRNLNFVFMIIRHQNDAGVMDGGGGGTMSIPKSYNTISIGGRAIPQSAALQLTAVRSSMIKRGTPPTNVGEVCRLKTMKNSYGPKGADADYAVIWHPDKFVNVSDEHFHGPALDYSFPFMQVLGATAGTGVTKVNNWSYNCKELGLEGVHPFELYRAIDKNESFKNKLGRMWNLAGYTDSLEAYIEKDIMAQAEDPSDPDEKVGDAV
jgi:RecA/RadA recombinase